MSGQDVERDVSVAQASDWMAGEVNIEWSADWVGDWAKALDRLDARVRELESELAQWTHSIATEALVAENAKLREAMNLAEHELVMGGGTTKPIINAAHILRAALADPFLPIGHPTC